MLAVASVPSVGLRRAIHRGRDPADHGLRLVVQTDAPAAPDDTAIHRVASEPDHRQRSPSLRASQQPAAREDRWGQHADRELAIALGVGHFEHPVRAVTLDRGRRDVAQDAVHAERVGPQRNVLAETGETFADMKAKRLAT